MPSSPPRQRPALTVLQLVPSLDTGGAERAAIDIAAALVARGDRALVASAGGRLDAELREAGGALHRLPVGAKDPVRMAANAFRIARLIRRERIDLLHARSRAAAWPAMLAARMTATPFVTTFHGIYAERNAAKRFYNSVMARADAVIANSHYTAKLIRERYATPAAKIVVIPRGIDHGRFDPASVSHSRRAALRAAWGISAGEKVVLQLARLTGWKGQRILIEAAALPPLAGREDIRVILAGDDQGRTDYRSDLDRLIAGRGLQRRLSIVGHCEDTPAAFALADVAVIASTAPEGFGRTAIEAAAIGLPVVATALGATGETVLAPASVAAERRTGWLVPPDDAAALSAAIGEALALSPEARRALSLRARAHAQHFTVSAMQAATLALYDRLVSRSGNADSFSKR